MTETSFSNEKDLFLENSYITEDNYDIETIDNSFHSNYNKLLDQPSFLVETFQKKKNSISFLNSKNLNFFEKQQISQKPLGRKSENIQENVLSLLKIIRKGPNVNIKMPKKTFNTKEEREFFNNLIVNKQKTELCKNWVLYKDCYFKDTCSFAHGEKELRKNSTPVNYKTKICKAFAENFFCSYGYRCHYSHNLRDKNPVDYKKLLEQLAQDFEKLILNKDNCDMLSILQIIQNKRKVARLNVFERISNEKY